MVVHGLPPSSPWTYISILIYPTALAMRRRLSRWLGRSPPTNEKSTQLAAGNGDIPQVTPALLEQSQQLSPESSPHIYQVNDDLVVKTGDGVRLAEAAAMRIVREKTSVPVPCVFDAYQRKDASGHNCIVMEFVQGSTLDAAWTSYNSAEKQRVVTQLKDYMRQLRSLEGSFIGAADKTHCEDQFFTNDDDCTYGPFSSEADFNAGLIAAIRAHGDNAWHSMVIGFLQQLPTNHRILFTHGDLMPRNIIVQGSEVVAILDWEMSGFYPEHWEYVKTMFWSDFASFWIAEGIVAKILQAYTHELAYLLHARDIIW